LNFAEPFIERAICEILYTGTLTYHEKRLILCKKLTEEKPELNNWTIDIPTIQLYNKNKEENSTKIFKVFSRGSFFLFKNPEQYDDFIVLADYLMTKTIQTIEINNLIRMGIRIFFAYGVKENTDQLKNLLITKLFNRKNIEKFDSNIKDITSIVEFGKDNYNYNIRICPISPKEIEGKALYKGEEYYIPEEDINPSLLVDLDMSKKNCSSKEVKLALKDSKINVQGILNNIFSLLKE